MSDRLTVIDGNGLTISQGGVEIGNIMEIGSLPGWSKEKIDDTAINNQKVKSYILGNLADWSDMEITVKFGGERAVSAGNSLWTINFPNSASLAFWGNVSSQGAPSVANGSAVLLPLTITVTNLSGGVVVPPVFTSGGIVDSAAVIVSSGGQV